MLAAPTEAPQSPLLSAVSPEELEAAAQQALWDFDATRLARRPLRVHARPDGTLVVSGPVRSRTVPSQIREILHSIPGVRSVEDRMTPDGDVEIRIAHALREDPRTAAIPPGEIVTRVTYGVATLLGGLPAGVEPAAVRAVAASVPGVHRIDDRLT